MAINIIIETEINVKGRGEAIRNDGKGKRKILVLLFVLAMIGRLGGDYEH